MIRKTKEQLLNEIESLKTRLNVLESADLEQKKVIEALSGSEAKYRLLFDAAYENTDVEKNKSEAIIAGLGDGIIIQDTDYKITYQNQVQNDIYGDKTGECCYRAYEGRDEICEDCPVERTFRDGKIHRSEKKVPTDNGNLYFELTSSPLKDSSGKIIAGIKIVRDITKSKRTEEKLREQEQFLDSILASIQDGIGVIDTDMNIIMANKTAHSWYPYAAPFAGKKCYEAYHSRNEPCEQCPAQETLKSGKSAYKVVPKHGIEGKEVGWLEIYSYPLNDTKTGQLSGIIEYVRDITKFKNAHESLIKSEEKFRGIFEQSPIAIELYDRGGNLIDVNRSCLALFGINDIKYVKGFKIFEDPNIAEDKKKRLLTGESIEFESVFDFELVKKARLYETTKSGKCYLDILIIPLITEERERYGYLVHLRDITRRKLAEKELSKNRTMLIKAQEIGHVGSWEWDIATNELIWSKEVYNIYALDPSIVKPTYDLVLESMAPESKNVFMKAIDDALKLRKPFEMEYSLIHPDGSRGYVHTKGEVLYDSKGHPITMYGMVQDITNRKQSEDKLKQSEEKYRLLIENILEGVFVIQDAKMVFVNKVFAEITGYPIEEIIGTEFYDFVAPEDLEMVKDRYYRRQKGENVPKEYEFHVLRKNGEKPVVNMTVGIVNYEGRVSSMGLLRDITVKKRAEESLKLFSEAVQNAPDGVQIVDLEGKIIYNNKAVEKIYGYSNDELIGKNVGEMNVDPGIAEKEIIPGIIEKSSWSGEIMVMHKDGHEFPIWLTTSLVKDKTGVPIALIGIIRDLTTIKRAEETLRLSNLVVENSQTVLFRWKAQEGWPVEFVSNNVIQFGYSAQEFLSEGLAYASIIHPDDLERVSKEVQEHSKIGNSRFQQEYRIMAKNGEVIWIDDRTVIERNRDGKITNYQGIIVDITERKKAEELILKYNIELENSNHMKELFIDIMHHDLLNPLNVANGYVELFMEDETNHQKISYLETIKRNLVKGMELIDNATKFSKLESMDYIKFNDLDLKIIIEEIVANITPLAFRAGMSIENKLNGSMPARANKIIEDVFINIISNAIKYAPEGKKIVVECKDSVKSWSVRVTDFGAGIRDAQKTLIFERFHREEKRGVKGSGLGLAIAGKIVELHKGKIWVEDNPEGGAVFVIEIPKSES